MVMPHPRMFDDDDPHLARVRRLAWALPDAAEKVSHGRPAFFTTKVFAYYGGSVKIDGAWQQRPHSVLVLIAGADHEALVAAERTYVPGYLGPSGWLGVELPSPEAGRDAWDEVAELLDASYRNTAGSRRIARLDSASDDRWLPKPR